MSDKDCLDYHNIGKPIKYSDKYKYVSGQMYEHHGTRMYDFNGEKLPSVTTILGLTKDQTFLRTGRQKLVMKKQNRLKIIVVSGAHPCINSWRVTSQELGTMTYLPLARRLNRWLKRLSRSVLHLSKNIMGLR